MNRTRDRVARLGAPILVLLATVIATVVAFVANGFTLRHACIPEAGFHGLLSADFALLRQTTGCPATMVEAGARPGGVVTIIAILAVPVLLAQLGTMLLVVTASTLTRRAVLRVIVLVAAALAAVFSLAGSRGVAHRLPRLRRPAPSWESPLQWVRHLIGARGVRGPPVAFLAVA